MPAIQWPFKQLTRHGIALLIAATVAGVMALEPRTPAGGSEQPQPAAPAPAPAKGKPARPDPDAPGPEAEVIGSSFCGTPACHGALVEAAERVRHTQWTADVKFKDAAGCEVCHGPASDHVGDPDKRKIYRFSVQTAENSRRINDACLKCHQKVVERQHFTSAAHSRADMSCATCHEVHYHLGTPYLLRLPGVGGPAGRPTSARDARRPPSPPDPAPAAPADPSAPDPPARPSRLGLAAQTRVPAPELRSSFPRIAGAVTEEQAINEVCSSCHRRQLTEARLLSHHPILEGRLKCTSCHDAHRGDQERAHSRGGVSDTCLKCHEQHRGPFRFEHDPVKAGGLGDSCMECHRAHGSPNRALTTQFSRGLCVQCHTDIQRDPPHRARTGDCWRSGCHVAVHGSNHSRFLFR